jgi:hypothetical protein
MARTGRPPAENPRDQILRVRLTNVEQTQILIAAGRAEQTVADWARAKLIAAAGRAARQKEQR